MKPNRAYSVCILLPLLLGAASLFCAARAAEEPPLPAELPDDPLADPPAGPEITEPVTNKSVTSQDAALLEKLLMRAAAKDISSDEAQSLRRVVHFLQEQLQEARKPTDEEIDLLDRLERDLKSRLDGARHPRPIRERLGILHVMREDWVVALKAFNRMGPASDHDPYHPLMLAYIYLHLMDYEKADAALAELQSLLHEHRPLRLLRPEFCTAITAYRDYAPRPGSDFRPGEDTLVYVEMEGVFFRREAGGMAGCDLSFDLALLDDGQKELWSQADYGPYARTFRGPIRDLHVSVYYRIPNNLPAGQYHLAITCRDLLAKKQGKCSLAFRIPPSNRVDPPREKKTEDTPRPDSTNTRTEETIRDGQRTERTVTETTGESPDPELTPGEGDINIERDVERMNNRRERRATDGP